ncbi:hypothetical protein HAX54_027313 [Datura stramonium]|uniref:Uncharacterized protein n=1 Tax=Datura stramonium TaxID=4076 RepID=A0ABS8S8M1_DATST|nr:hypothetical protein [Datura stramonium]
MALYDNNNIGEEARQILAAQAHIWNHTFNYINSMSLKCAIQLGIPDIIHSHGQAMTLSNLVNSLPINNINGTTRDYIYRLMRILIHAGFFVQTNSINKEENDEEEGGYLLTPTSRLLIKDEPLSLVPFVQWILPDWSDEDCIKILRKCKEAIPNKENGGKVIIIDMVLMNQKGDHKAYETQLFMDMLTMVHPSGKERSQQEWAKLFSSSGFNDYKKYRD